MFHAWGDSHPLDSYTGRPWALILKIHCFKFCQKLHWLSFFGTKPQRYMVLEVFHITSRYTVFWVTLIDFGPSVSQGLAVRFSEKSYYVRTCLIMIRKSKITTLVQVSFPAFRTKLLRNALSYLCKCTWFEKGKKVKRMESRIFFFSKFS